MRLVRDGIAASPGIVVGPAYVLRWEMPRVPHVTLEAHEVDAEIERFDGARTWAQQRIREIQRNAAAQLGPIEAQIFEPQLLMLDDPQLVDGTIEYIRENHISAARAFELRMLELQSEWSNTGHPMILDRLTDLIDVKLRVIRRLLDIADPDLSLGGASHPVIIVAKDLTPTVTVQLERSEIGRAHV